jgi:hypothetical protein
MERRCFFSYRRIWQLLRRERFHVNHKCVYSATIRTDQGPEFTCRALDQWAYEHGVALRLIQQYKPAQDGFIGSFNGRLRDECLNEHWFSDISHAGESICERRKYYDDCRPYSTLNYLTPSEFSSGWRKGNSESEAPCSLLLCKIKSRKRIDNIFQKVPELCHLLAQFPDML